jgi:hypothetical protein
VGIHYEAAAFCNFLQYNDARSLIASALAMSAVEEF